MKLSGIRILFGLALLISWSHSSLAEKGSQPTPKVKWLEISPHYFRTVVFVPVLPSARPVNTFFDSPSFEGKILIRDSSGAPRFKLPPGPVYKAGPLHIPTPADVQTADIYIQDGSETSIAVNYEDDNNLVACYNTAWSFIPDIPHSNSTDGNISWTSRTFPDGIDIYTGYPFDPWVNAGNAAGEFYSTLIRHSVPSGQSRCIIGKSIDGGQSFSLFYENALSEDIFQDREMVDIDRTTLRGGGTGTTHDDKVYLCYDEWTSIAFTNYLGSYLQVISPSGSALTKVNLTAAGGIQFQPVAGITDGTFYLLSRSLSPSGNNVNVTAHFHQITNGGAGPNTFAKSSIPWVHAGQRFGTTSRVGVNGHRMDRTGFLDIDRSTGPRRGYLYYIYNPNPNPDDSPLDQRDVGIALSTNGVTSWSSALIPTAPGKTQYFPMLDVDEEGWLHVAYYQNDTGSVDGGVLEASSANLYYTLSYDGGSNWSNPVQINSPGNALDYEDPAPDRAFSSYYVIGDYQQLRAVNTDTTKKVYVLWSHYDKDRTYAFVGDSPDRVYCTTLEYSFNAVAPTITLFSPNGGEIWQIDSLHTISWSASDNDSIASVELRLDRGNDGTYEELIANVSGNPGQFDWTVTGPLALQARVQAIAHDTSGNSDSDESDSSFLIGCLAKPGDANASDTYTLADPIAIVNYVFNKPGCAPTPLCWLSNLLCRGAWDASGTVTLGDAIRGVNYIFNKPGGPWNALPVGVCCL